jgi:hypothetical protein
MHRMRFDNECVVILLMEIRRVIKISSGTQKLLLRAPLEPHVVRRYGVKGDFLYKSEYSKNFDASTAAIFADAHRYRKLIKAEGPFLVKLRGCRFRFKRLLHFSDVSRL